MGDGHGTHVTGIIGVSVVGRKNSIGVAKQAPGTHDAIRPRPVLR